MPVEHATAREVTQALTEKLICYFGPPVTLISDQGAHFMNRVMEEFARIFRVNKYSTTAYYPQSNGGIERMHHTLKEYIKMYIEGNEKWDELVPLAQHAYNSTEHDGLGYSPHELVFGRRARTPSSFPPRDYLQTYDAYLADSTEAYAQLRTMAAMNLVQSKYRSKYYYDRKLNVQHFREGEMVYVLKEPKVGQFKPEYKGPCEIIGINYSTHNAKIQKGNKTRIVNLNKLKRSIKDNDQNNKGTGSSDN